MQTALDSIYIKFVYWFYMKKYLLYTAYLLLIACNRLDNAAKDKEQNRESLTKSVHTSAFNQSFGALLNEYYALKDNFIAENDSLINQSAKTMVLLVDSLELTEFFADSNVLATAKPFVFGISSELIGLIEEKKMEEKLKSFQMVSDQLYELIRTVKYGNEVVYLQYCPTAFSDQGAHWLSNSTIISNPYQPRNKRICGVIKDSINIRLK